jgi:hypothetical protein
LSGKPNVVWPHPRRLAYGLLLRWIFVALSGHVAGRGALNGQGKLLVAKSTDTAPYLESDTINAIRIGLGSLLGLREWPLEGLWLREEWM